MTGRNLFSIIGIVFGVVLALGASTAYAYEFDFREEFDLSNGRYRLELHGAQIDDDVETPVQPLECHLHHAAIQGTRLLLQFRARLEHRVPGRFDNAQRESQWIHGESFRAQYL